MRRRRNFRKGGRPRRFHEGGPTLMPGGNPYNDEDWMMILPHDHPHSLPGSGIEFHPPQTPGHIHPGRPRSIGRKRPIPRPIPRPPGPGMPPPRIPDIYRAGGRAGRYMHGGHAHGNRSCPGGYCGGGRTMSNSNGCGPGYHMMPDGTCMAGDYHGQYGNGYAHGGHIAPGVGVCDEPSTAIDGFGNNIC